jgi:hypothetical protein
MEKTKEDLMDVETENKTDYTKRKVPKVPLPLTKSYLKASEVFDEEGNVQFENLKKHLASEGKIEKGVLIDIIKKTAVLFAKEPNLLYIHEPVTGTKLKILKKKFVVIFMVNFMIC